jgi:hypothetical protein
MYSLNYTTVLYCNTKRYNSTVPTPFSPNPSPNPKPRCGLAIGAPAVRRGVAIERGPSRGGISGAHMRCLTIGLELVNRPSLIFLENPLFGLDRHNSMVVCDVLRNLSAGSRTLVCSVQTPPPLHVFDLFDDLLLLGRGLLVYSGPTGG